MYLPAYGLAWAQAPFGYALSLVVGEWFKIQFYANILTVKLQTIYLIEMVVLGAHQTMLLVHLYELYLLVES